MTNTNPPCFGTDKLHTSWECVECDNYYEKCRKEKEEKDELRALDSQQEKTDCQRDIDNEKNEDINENIN